LSFNENKATSAPEIIKLSNNNTISIMTRKVVPCRLVARRTKER